MLKINASEFKARCLRLLDDVARTGEGITVLKRGKPIAQVVPVVESKHRYPQESLRGTVEILGDIVSPCLSPEDWEAEGRR